MSFEIKVNSTRSLPPKRVFLDYKNRMWENRVTVGAYAKSYRYEIVDEHTLRLYEDDEEMPEYQYKQILKTSLGPTEA